MQALDYALTRRQRDIYEYLVRQRERSAHPPTLDEVCQALGLASRGSLHKHVQGLIEAGLVEPMDRLQRGVRLVETDEEGTLPLLGRIAAGRPIEALAHAEPVEVPEVLRGRGRCFVLEVRGDSMIEDGILDGDRVVVEQRENPRNGETVVALIDGAEATLKRFEQRRSRVILHPANAGMAPMEFAAERVTVQGVVRGLMRAYR